MTHELPERHAMPQYLTRANQANLMKLRDERRRLELSFVDSVNRGADDDRHVVAVHIIHAELEIAMVEKELLRIENDWLKAEIINIKSEMAECPTRVLFR